jgi:hypothetical protein
MVRGAGVDSRRREELQPAIACGAAKNAGGAVEEEIHVTHEPANAERGGGPIPPERTGIPRGWYLLLVIPLIGTLIPPIYNSEDPTLIGIPFFYWYLLLWVPISVVCTAVFHRATRRDR